MSSKKIFFILVVMVGIIAALIGYNRYRDHQASLTKVTINYNTIPGVTVQLFKGAKKDLVQPEITGKPVSDSVSNGTTYILEDWPYVVIASGNNIETTKQIIYPHQIPQTITLSIGASESRLTNLLADNKDMIANAINQSNAAFSSLYTISDIKLFGDGSWATARLQYTGADKFSRDPLVTVLHKKSDSWSIAAGPRITISRTEAPGAPDKALWSILPTTVQPS